MKIVFQIGKKMLLFLCAFIPVAEVFSVECNKTVPSVSAVCSEYDYIPQIDETEYYIAARKDIIVQGNTPFKRYGFAEDANSGETFVCLAEKNETVTTNYNLDDEIQLDVPEPNPASDFEYELNKDGDGVTITHYIGTNPVISIPSEIEGLPVTEVARFSDSYVESNFRSTVLQVFFPDTVTEVGRELLASCKKLNYVRLSQNCSKISLGMFGGCESLKSIQIPECVTTIGDGAFGETGLTSIQIPGSVTKFGMEIFYRCEKLSSVKLPDTMTFIPRKMFSYCDALKTIELPSGIEKLEYQCFYNSGISEIKLPQNLKEIGEDCFCSCESLESIEIPESVKTIEGGAFSGTSITELIIPDSVDTKTEMGDFRISFIYGMDKLEVLRIPNSIRIIEDIHRQMPFFPDDVKKTLRSVNLPSSLEVIVGRVFEDMPNLTELVIPDSLNKNIFDMTSEITGFVGTSKLPLLTQKRLKDLGYIGSFNKYSK